MNINHFLLPELASQAEIIKNLAINNYGLSFDPIEFILVDHDELNAIAAYGGFVNRYPHWTFGMEFERLKKGYDYGASKIYELVINNNPVYAYLMRSNLLVDQKLVMAHVCGHADFFKNNLWFKDTSKSMIDQMANNANRIRRISEVVGQNKVERFVDICLSLENLIDYHSLFVKRKYDIIKEDPSGYDEKTEDVIKFPAKPYLDRYINTKQFLDDQRKRIKDESDKKKKSFPEQPERDILGFLIEHAPMDRWKHDILAMMREEFYYFVPQRITKIANEGWACVSAETLVFTEFGLVPMGKLIEKYQAINSVSVIDGVNSQKIYGSKILCDMPGIKIKTRRGLFLSGSITHRLLLDDGSWRSLDELKIGDILKIAGGCGTWAKEEILINWKPSTRITLGDIAKKVGISSATVVRYFNGKNIKKQIELTTALKEYNSQKKSGIKKITFPTNRKVINIPTNITPSLGAFLGYLIGDGHISRSSRMLGLTSGDKDEIDRFVVLVNELFGIGCKVKYDTSGNAKRWRATIYSENLSDFLVEYFGLTEGVSARKKRIPDLILQSPEPVVREFLRAYFDCDGYGGKRGVILSTSSDFLAEQTQLLLLNYGILSRRHKGKDECWQVRVAGLSAKKYAEKIGFNLSRKQKNLEEYINNHIFYKKEEWNDEVVSIESVGNIDVYDISVENTHQYVGAGFINHNSFMHSKLMTEKLVTDSEIIDYCDHHSGVLGGDGFNPYKIGIELFRDIEDRWNRGAFGLEYETCEDEEKKRTWDKKLNKGWEKVLQVRQVYNDINFIEEFFTKDFCARNKLFTFEHYETTEQYEAASYAFSIEKPKLLIQLTNGGNPVIELIDANFQNKSELFLKHIYDGRELDVGKAADTLEGLYEIWTRPVNVETVISGKISVIRYDGKEHSVVQGDDVVDISNDDTQVITP